MKIKFVLSFLVICMSNFVLAQTENWHKKRISATIFENYLSSPTDKKIKNGAYTVTNMDNQVLVRGQFKEGKKDSVWNFFNTKGDIIQSYNYSTNKLLYKTTDQQTIVKQRSEIDTAVAETDKITGAQKIGGVNYGFYLIHSEKTLPPELKNQKNDVLMEYVFTISETGKMEDWQIVYTSTFFNDKRKQSISGLPADAYEFVPATVNGQPIKSKLVYQIMIYVNQARDRGTYNVVTQQNQ